ncbi:MAG TPA: FAD-binding oxidoreductase [Myxococcales bacterium]|nr:FAD-binding oxidoreductase [Myxococcales bacterium]
MISEAALRRLEAALPPGAVVRSEAERAAAERATFATTQRIAAIAYPASRDEVRSALRVAAEEGFSVHPVSRGRNHGFGSRVPPRDGCVLLDLSRMDRVVAHDEALGLLTVEPGVTFQQAHRFLAERGSRLRLTTIGGPPDASLIGNALERGEGRGPHSDAFAHACDLEVVLSTGEVLQTGLGRFGDAARARGLHKWGLGPSLDGLFSQAALGVVTRATLWLSPASEFMRDVVATVPEAGGLPGLVDAFRELLLEGTLRSNAVLWNDVKAVALSRQYPFEEAGGRTPLPPQLLAELRAQVGSGAWNGATTVFAPDRGMGLTALRRARRALVRAGAEVRSLGVEDGAQPQGVPSGWALRMAYWRKRSPPPESPDLDRDGCGFIWVDVAVPFTGAAAAEAVQIAASAVPLFGFEPNLSLLSAGPRCLFLAALLAYDREAPGEDERALACHRALMRELGAAGFVPLRTGVESVGVELPRTADDSDAVLARVKAALDPAGALAGGKHGRR